jgi:hypothetical protein
MSLDLGSFINSGGSDAFHDTFLDMNTKTFLVSDWDYTMGLIMVSLNVGEKSNIQQKTFVLGSYINIHLYPML